MGYKRAIQTFNYLETWEYEKDITTTHRARQAKKPRIETRPRSYFSIQNARKTLTRTIMANIGRTENSAFLTFTFVDIVPLRSGYRIFTAYIKTLRRYYGLKFDYVVVPEFQKRGSVHFHALFFGIEKEIISQEPDTRFFQNTWAHGFVDCLNTDNSPKVAFYMAKYLSKSLSDSRSIGAKAYSTSRGIVRPVLFKTKEVVDFVTEDLSVDKLVDCTAEYDTMHLGRCTYKRYNLTKI